MRFLLAVPLTLLSLVPTAAAVPSPAAGPSPVWAPEKTRDEIDWDTLEESTPITNTTQLQARVNAARGIAKRATQGGEPDKVVARFDALGGKFLTDAQLRRVLAECIGQLDSPGTQKMLAKSMLGGAAYEQIFRLRAARECAPGPVDDSALKLLSNKDDGVRREALDVLVRHKHMPVVKSLEGVLKSGKDDVLLGPAVDAISELIGDGEGWNAWEQQLFGFARAPNANVRRAALTVLSRQQDATRLALYLECLQHDDWATRSIALSWLAASNSKEAVAAIIERFLNEPPDSRLAADCGDTLRKMTGQPLQDDAQMWDTWWKNVMSTFEFPKAKGPKTGSAKRPPPVSGTKAPQFYGIEVRSQRVVFVVDVSGSMESTMVGKEYVGEPRIEGARRELVKIIDVLTPGSLFNIISFNDAVVPWLDSIDEAADVASGGKGGKGARKGPTTGPEKEDTRDEKTRARDAEKQAKADELLRTKAKEYVGRLNAAGGTNIHDAFEIAFEDQSVDTIFFLSDGIPSTGKEVDPVAIREVIRRWNESRRIKINCIAIGIELPLLKWVAEDSGGEYKFFP